MKIVLMSSTVDLFGFGDTEVSDVEEKLISASFEVEKIVLPFILDGKSEFTQMVAFHAIDLSAADVVLTFGFPAVLIRHKMKIIINSALRLDPESLNDSALTEVFCKLTQENIKGCQVVNSSAELINILIEIKNGNT